MLDRGAGDPAPVIVALPPQIHASCARDAFDSLYAAITSGAVVVVADLSGTVACDLVSVYGLIRVGDWASARKVTFRLAVPPGASLGRVLELLGLDHLLAVYPSVSDALRATEPPAAV